MRKNRVSRQTAAPTNSSQPFVVPANPAGKEAVDRMAAAGYQTVPAYNPYWDRHGHTYEDPDGCRVVLQNADWPEVD